MTFNTAGEGVLRCRGRIALGGAATLLAAVALAAPPGPASARVSYGVVTQGYPQDVRDFEFKRMGRGDVSSVRFILLWSLIQATPGPCGPGPFNPVLGDEDPEPPENHCDWSSIDRMVGGAAARGTASLPFVFGSPEWTDSNDGEPGYAVTRVPPLETEADRLAWQTFLRAALRRYGPTGTFWAPGGDYAAQHPGAGAIPIGDWQVWNEPSSPAYFWPKPSPAGYADLLGLSAEVIRAEDPGARIVLAGLFGTPGGGPGGIFLPRFLDRLYDVQGVEEDFDAVALHPYSPGIEGMKAQIELARHEMKRAGDAGTDLWITELGWASDGPKEIQAVKSERGQARMLTRAFEVLGRNRGRWNVIGVNWFSLRDTPKKKSPCPGCPFTGLVERDGDPKPAWRAFAKFTR
jgi:polysaccharide biosynthesis protein PslG